MWVACGGGGHSLGLAGHTHPDMNSLLGAPFHPKRLELEPEKLYSAPIPLPTHPTHHVCPSKASSPNFAASPGCSGAMQLPALPLPFPISGCVTV